MQPKTKLIEALVGSTEKGSISISKCAREFGVDITTIMDIVSKMKSQKPLSNPNTNNIQSASKSLPLEKQKDLSLEELIQKGESDTLEFKSSMLTPTRPEPNIAAIEEQIKFAIDVVKKQYAKSVSRSAQSFRRKIATRNCEDYSSFSQLRGWDITCWSRRSISGIEKDFKSIHGIRKNLDGWLQHLVAMITNQIGPEFTQYIKVSPITYQSNTVAKIIVTKSGRPAYVEKKDVEFYIRSLNTTHALNTRQAKNYIDDHWKN